MSKLTGPCLSLSASGKLANALVYSVWKGINYARQYVIPANPQTAAQTTQRGYLTSALALWHDVVNALSALDKASLNRGATVIGKVMSGFNLYVRNYVLTRVAGATPIQLFDITEVSWVAPNVQIVAYTAAATINAKLRYGYSPTSMPYEITRTEGAVAGTTHTFDLAAVSAGQTIYYQVFDLTANSVVNGGIGKGTAT